MRTLRGPLHPGVRLTSYVDGRLPIWQRLLVEHHLGRCTRCALEVARGRGLVQRLAAAPPPALPPHLADRLRAIPGPFGRPSASPPPARQPEPSPRPRQASGAVGIAVAGVVLVGAAGTGALVTSPPTTWSPPPPVASFNDVLLPWQSGSGPDGAVDVRPVDNDDRP